VAQLFEIPGLNIYMQILVTLISILIHVIATRRKGRSESVVELVAIYTIGLAGWFTISNGLLGHILYADQVASNIGWPIQSGFQMELGFAAIGMGLVGAIGFWNKSFWLPFIIGKSSLMWGAGLTHILDMIQNDNFSPSNTGLIVYWDFLLPVLLIVLYTLYLRESKFRI
jgi:hypothetical protein